MMTFAPEKVPDVAPTAIPVRWLPHSVFDHSLHRPVGCVECHKASASKETTDVLLPSANVCRECHRPAAGARSGCVECHIYHDKSKDRDLNGPFTIQRLVKGKSR
jgi:predicted CXXCH cytochrome family protein